MITLLRNIRKSLIETSNTKKYALYAAGEILLVVIGILIALQINNWNEKRKNAAVANSYLLRMSSELRKDTSILSDKIQLSDQLSKDYINFIQEMYKTQKSKEDYIQLVSFAELNVDELILTDKAYSEMVNTGKVDLMDNSLLKEKITEYYRQYDFVASRVRELNSSNIEVINAASTSAPNLKYAMKGYLDLVPKEKFPNNDYMYSDSDWAFINSPQSIEFRLYEEAIYYYYLKQNLIKPMFVDLIDKANQILILLEKTTKK